MSLALGQIRFCFWHFFDFLHHKNVLLCPPFLPICLLSHLNNYSRRHYCPPFHLCFRTSLFLIVRKKIQITPWSPRSPDFPPWALERIDSTRYFIVWAKFQHIKIGYLNNLAKIRSYRQCNCPLYEVKCPILEGYERISKCYYYGPDCAVETIGWELFNRAKDGLVSQGALELPAKGHWKGRVS